MSTTPSPTPNSTIINPVTDFTWVAVTYLGDTLFLLFLLTGPLLKLAKSRFAVFLIYSKCIATVLDLPVSVANMQIPLKVVQNPLTIVVRFHVLGLALNRAHSVLFPFHYSHMASKSIIRFSLFIWAISLFVGLVAISISFAVGDVNYQILGSVRTQCNLIVASAAALIYVGMSAKLLWTKYFGAKGQSTHQQYEKDHMRIFMVCLISVIPFLLAYLSKNYLPISTCPDWVQSTVNILGAFFDSLSFIAEEVCLILISGEFRRIIGAHLQRILYGKSSSSPKNGPTKSNIMTMINVAPLTINVENRRSFLTIEPMPSVGGALARNSARI